MKNGNNSITRLSSKITEMEPGKRVAATSKDIWFFPLKVDLGNLRNSIEQEMSQSRTLEVSEASWEILKRISKNPVVVSPKDLSLLNDSRLWFLGLTGNPHPGKVWNHRLHDKKNLHWMASSTGVQDNHVLLSRSEMQLTVKVAEEKISALRRILKATRPINQEEINRLKSRLPSLWKRFFWKYQEVEEYNTALKKKAAREEIKRQLKTLRKLRRSFSKLTKVKYTIMWYM